MNETQEKLSQTEESQEQIELAGLAQKEGFPHNSPTETTTTNASNEPTIVDLEQVPEAQSTSDEPLTISNGFVYGIIKLFEQANAKKAAELCNSLSNEDLLTHMTRIALYLCYRKTDLDIDEGVDQNFLKEEVHAYIAEASEEDQGALIHKSIDWGGDAQHALLNWIDHG